MKTTYNHLTHSYETPDKTTVAAEICEGDTPSDAFRAAAIREQQRTWVGLTRAERFEIEKAMSKYYDYQHECKTVCLPEFAAAIEAKLKDKNL